MSSSISCDLPRSDLPSSEPPRSDLARSDVARTDVARSDVARTELTGNELEPGELLPGTQLGNYIVQACIGRGAMATVYRAEHCLLHKQVALKVMAPSLHASAEARQRFLREARAVSAIQHPNVVAIADAGLVDGTPYLVMELLEGQDLEQHLEQNGPFSGQELAQLALPLVAALAAAHDAGVIHRDLKPGNIFLARGPGGELMPKLLDFGISKFEGATGAASLAMTAFDQLMGSPLYLPPEALQGSRELTARSDQYSLGVVLYECITGRAPFIREDLLPLLNAISEGTCTAPRNLRPETPEGLERVILRAMSVEPQQRFDHMRDLGRALLAQADQRTRDIWAPAFATTRALAGLVPGAPASRWDEAEPAARSRVWPVAQRAGSARPRSLWAALALLGTGALLLVLAFGRLQPTRARPAPWGTPLELPVEAASVEPARREPPSVPPSVAAAELETPLPETPLPGTSAREVAPRVSVLQGGAPAPARAPRAPSRRPRGSDTNREVDELFFSKAAGAGQVPAQQRERSLTPRVRISVGANEAPLFD